jgi:hypothetical protein
VDEQPAPEPGQELPSRTVAEGSRTPRVGSLTRDAAVSGKFTAPGQLDSFRFEAEAGELSLFDMGRFGYARGGQSTGLLRILDADGEALKSVTQAGGPVNRKFVPFVAPATGLYTLELSTTVGAYRYQLVRHSRYYLRAADELLDFGSRDALHGWLAGPADEVSYSVDFVAGQELFLSVRNTTEAARQERRLERKEVPWDVVAMQATADGHQTAGHDDPGEEARGSSRAGRAGTANTGRSSSRAASGASEFPQLLLRVTRDGEDLSASLPSVLFTPTTSGRHVIVVSAPGSAEGGLFDLAIEHEPPKVAVHGFVGDHDDEPVGGLVLHFLRQPELDYVGKQTTDQSGEFALEVPPGDYVIFLVSREARRQVLRVAIPTARELNAIFTEK